MNQEELKTNGYTPHCFGNLGHPSEDWVACDECKRLTECEIDYDISEFIRQTLSLQKNLIDCRKKGFKKISFDSINYLDLATDKLGRAIIDLKSAKKKIQNNKR